MGRTLPSITQAFLQEQESFARFRRALRRSDQLVLDELLRLLINTLPLPLMLRTPCRLRLFLLSMLLEDAKKSFNCASLDALEAAQHAGS